MTSHPRTAGGLREARKLPMANRLLAGLPARIRKDLLNCCEEVELTYGELLSESAETVRYAYFPADGFISLMMSVGRHTNEVSLVGNEGMFSPTSTLGFDVSPLRALVQGSGHALRMTTADLRRTTERYPPLRDTLNRYVCVIIAELAQTALCNGCHTIEARLARWLLMTHDRAHSDRLQLTHGLLARMLGVRRSGVSVAAAALQTRKAIRYRRGEVSILDRDRLEAVACECYGAAKSVYRHYLG